LSIDAVLPYLERAEHADAGLYQGDPDATAAMAVDERSHARVLTRLQNMTRRCRYQRPDGGPTITRRHPGRLHADHSNSLFFGTVLVPVGLFQMGDFVAPD
jgi:hypothetical protein